MAEYGLPTPGPWSRSELDDHYIVVMRTLQDKDTGTEIPQAQSICRVAPRLGQTDANAALIVSACNACHQINPENPQAVADAFFLIVNEIKTLLKNASYADGNGYILTQDAEAVELALAKAESR